MTIWDNDELMVELREIDNNIDMQNFFQNINLNNWLDDSVGYNIDEITQTDYQQKEQEMGNKFKDEVRKEKIDVTCPHCFEEFELDKKDL